MKYAWLLISVFAARFFATAISAPAVDGDLGWQRRLGAQILRAHRIPNTLGAETFSAPYHPWLAQEWAFSIGAALARPGLGWCLFAGSCAAAAVTALAVAGINAQRRGASPRAIAVCTTLGGVSLFASFGVRAQVIAWPLAALVLFVLACDGPLAYTAPALTALWSNLHASAVVAPAAAGALCAGAWLEDRCMSARVNRLLVVTGGCMLGVCCNPFGIALPRYALGLMGRAFKRYITEWQPTSLWEPSFALGALPLLMIALVLLAGARRHGWRDLFLLAPFTYLLLSAARNIALFGIVALPLAACALTRNVAWFSLPAPAQPRNSRFERFALPVFCGAAAVVVALVLVRQSDRSSDVLGTRALSALAAMPGEHRLLCADFAWCGPAGDFRGIRIFLDGRADPFPPRVWRDFVTIAGLRSGWRTTLRKDRVNAVLVRVAAPLDQALMLTPGWRAAYRDAEFRVWSLSDRNRIDRRFLARAVSVRNDQRKLTPRRDGRKNDSSHSGRNVALADGVSAGKQRDV